VTAAVVADELENSQALAVADDGLSIDRTRAHRQRRDGCRNQRKAVGKVVTVPADQSNLGAITASQDSKAVVLNLMNPVGASRRSFARPWQTWLDITGRRTADTRAKQRHGWNLSGKAAQIESISSGKKRTCDAVYEAAS
jgi:hypothetical protein